MLSSQDKVTMMDEKRRLQQMRDKYQAELACKAEVYDKLLEQLKEDVSRAEETLASTEASAEAKVVGELKRLFSSIMVGRIERLHEGCKDCGGEW